VTPIEAQITGDPTWQLGQLADALRAEVARRRAAYPEIADGVCRFCGKPWPKWLGSKMDGHAACAVSPDFMRQVVAFSDEHYSVSLTTIASRLGVGDGVVRAWWNIVKGNPRR
jgi:hypothetical protein